MSVVVKGMRIPESCNVCRFQDGYTAEAREALRMAIKALEVQDILLKALSYFETTIPCDQLMNDDPDEEEICSKTCDVHGDCIPPKCWLRWAQMKARKEDDA